MTIILAAFTFISCDNKKNTQEEKKFTKAQASYDKNGIDLDLIKEIKEVNKNLIL